MVGQNTIFGQLMVGQLYLHMAIFLVHNAKKVKTKSTMGQKVNIYLLFIYVNVNLIWIRLK